MIEELLNMHVPLWEAALRLGAALLLAGVIGWEREVTGRAAGLRTHMLVSLGAAGFALIGVESMMASRAALAELNADAARIAEAGGDPLRIIEAVATGVGFLGAGAILQAGARVKGLTTAASIWVVAAVGLASGVGLWAIATLLTATGLVTLTLLRWLEPPAKALQQSQALGPRQESDA